MILLLVVGCLRMLDNPNDYIKKYYPHSSELIPLLHEMVLEERKNMLGSINGDGTFTGMKKNAFSDGNIKSVRIPGDAHIHFLNIHNKGNKINREKKIKIKCEKKIKNLFFFIMLCKLLQ